MGIKSKASRMLASIIVPRIRKDAARAAACQRSVLENLISTARNTAFGKAHHFSEIRNHQDFRQAIAISDYEDLKDWIERSKNGEEDVLWPGKPMYFCKTSGTTSGTKYIPLTRDSMPNHIQSARNALLCYVHETGRSAFVDGKMIFLQGSPKLDALPSGIPYGRLSGIVANHVPAYLQRNRLPSMETNSIDDWETKVRAIVDETIAQDMRLISGIPSWVQMYFELLLEKSGAKNIRALFPHFDLFVYGGVNYEPYRKKLEELIGWSIPTIETYPASEGFIAYQDSQSDDGLLLNVHSGIFFEFIPADKTHEANPPRYSIEEVRMGEQYAIVLSTNAGLWGYLIGDTVRFVSLDPPRIKVTGRIKHFTSAFGEHVIAEEVERAMSAALTHFAMQVNEFHVAPVINPDSGLPYHHWVIEFDHPPVNLSELELYLDAEMTRQNIYYRDLITGNVLRTLRVTPVRSGTFQAYMKSVGRLGGQNKVQRLANDHVVADELLRHSR